MNIICGGRGTELGQPLPVEVYDIEAGIWSRLVALGLFRHASWVHDNLLYVYGGFEYINPKLAVNIQLFLNMIDRKSVV